MSYKSSQSNNPVRAGYLLLLTMLSTGVLSGCQYCEPLLLASLITGTVFKLLTAQSTFWNKPLRNTTR